MLYELWHEIVVQLSTHKETIKRKVLSAKLAIKTKIKIIGAKILIPCMEFKYRANNSKPIDPSCLFSFEIKVLVFSIII
jgi:hypothetical protein